MLKNITLSADEELLKLAREKAKKEHTSLNSRFRKWLMEYTRTSNGKDYKRLMDTLSYVDSGRKFTREEMNER